MSGTTTIVEIPFTVDRGTEKYDLSQLDEGQLVALITDATIEISRKSGGAVTPKRVLQIAAEMSPPDEGMSFVDVSLDG